jgi:F-type H+-transporting ATPase subunit delta
VAELTTLARPYAKAAFEVALQDNALENWSRMLALSAAIAREQGINSVLSSPSLWVENFAAEFIDVCGDELDAMGQRLVLLLA